MSYGRTYQKKIALLSKILCEGFSLLHFRIIFLIVQLHYPIYNIFEKLRNSVNNYVIIYLRLNKYSKAPSRL